MTLEEIKHTKQKLTTTNDESQITIAAEDQLILNEFQNIGVQISKLKEQQDLLKKDVVDILEDYELLRYESNKGLISYKKASTRKGIDTTRLKKELPDVAEKYTKISNVSASVSFRVK